MSKQITTTLEICMGGYSSEGKRGVNQDAFAVKDPSSSSEKQYKGIVACVADGVSCSNNGQQASHTSVTQFINDYYCTNSSWDVKKSVGKVLSSLNSWLYHHSKGDTRHNGLITTFSSIVFKSTTAHLFHVGDSRIYRYRAGVLTQLTLDHSRAAYGNHNILTRALGMDYHVDIDYRHLPLQQGDIYLLSSDGVHDTLSNKNISKHLDCHNNIDVTSKTLETLAKVICQDAINHDSADNVSCLLLKIQVLPKSDINEIFNSLSKLVIPPAMQIGNEIDNFKIDQILHQGPRSHLYLATEKNSKQQVVLKMPSLNYSDDHTYLEGFYKEQWAGQQLKHPNIMAIQPRLTESPFLYHICDYVDGITLRQWMFENPEPNLDVVTELIKKIVNAVRVLQRSAMVHRDIKPENIIINKDNHITLIDFGTVKISGIEEISEALEELPLGAAFYIAPEYLYTGNSSVLSDLFSIAVIAYEMLCGGLPYQENNPQSLQKIERTPWLYREIKHFRAGLPGHIDSVLQKATHPELNKRYSSMSEFVTELAKVKSNTVLDQQQSLMEQNPIKFWKLLSSVLFVMAIIELFVLLTIK